MTFTKATLVCAELAARVAASATKAAAKVEHEKEDGWSSKHANSLDVCH